jgi:hypothetical protein
MSGFETRFGADEDAEHIRSAFYGFVGQHAGDVEGDAHIRTEIDAGRAQLLVRLWSADAMAAFLAGLGGDRWPARRPAHE